MDINKARFVLGQISRNRIFILKRSWVDWRETLSIMVQNGVLEIVMYNPYITVYRLKGKA
jgi:hypothetical protein